MNFQSDLGALASDLMETRGWERARVLESMSSKVEHMRKITRNYGDNGRIRGGRDYLERLYGGDPKNDHFDDLIIDAIRKDVPWGNIIAGIMAVEVILSTGGRGR